ncbi:hypothetical protein B9Z55_025367 [Caenorhabditis nigoni]|uniref:DUF19 domain-containing protein n=1 Tax=Caenorhabditis nigoni TaxID=1611254 RepID=A0A2G5SY37_9PELO|nr:hypothetical protein B9Z55_025367 [Caenorhabditis nigoni]
MVRALLLIVRFATSHSFIVWPESQLLKSLREEFGQFPACSTELNKFNECVKPHEISIGIFEKGMSERNLELIYNQELMEEFSKIAKNISTCFGHDGQCKISRAVAFALDTAHFVKSKIYGDAFSCFRDSNIILMENCLEIDQHPPSFYTSDNDSIRSQKKEKALLKCASRKLYPTPSCSIEKLVHLYQAFQPVRSTEDSCSQSDGEDKPGSTSGFQETVKSNFGDAGEEEEDLDDDEFDDK